MYHSEFWRDVLERVVWTFVQAFTGSLGSVPLLEVVLPDGAINLSGLQTIVAGGMIAGVSAVLTLMKGIAAGRLAKTGTAQLIPGSHTYGHDVDLESPDAREFD